MTVIHDRFDPAQNFDAILFRQDKVLQSAELNEMQSAAARRLADLANVLFRNGDVVRGARIIVNAATGATRAEKGQVYLQGQVRDVPEGAFTVPVKGVVNVGLYLKTSIVTELEDPSLLNPATGSPAHQQPGALRRKVQPVWGWAEDGQAGDFFPVWTVEDGLVRAKEPPPNLEAVTQALARYDRDSTGGSYIVDGLQVAMAADLASGEQVYTVAEGRAHVNGYGCELQASRRIVYPTAPDLLTVDSEPHLSESEAPQRIDVGRPPMKGVPQVRITARKTVQIVHGGFSGAADPLPDPSVIQIESVKQGAATYQQPADFKLAAGQLDWSPAGAEPAPGSIYQVTYLYMATVAPTAVDARGFTVSGAVTGTMSLVTYAQQLPRIDRLCMDSEGRFKWVKGISSAWSPTPPVVPDDLLILASVYQSWDANRRVINDGVKIIHAHEQAGERRRLDDVILDLAELRLSTSAQGLDSGIKKGLFADPFLSDAQRDAGMPQTAAIVRGALQLPLTTTVHQLGKNIGERIPLQHAYRVVLAQNMKTDSMQVNPYQAFDPIPASVTLTPNVDRWTETTTQWASTTTERFWTPAYGGSAGSQIFKQVRELPAEEWALETLRSIPVRFDIEGWGPNEPLGAVTFDGITVTAQPVDGGTLKANAAGRLSGQFDIPPGIKAGTKAVVFTGTMGAKGQQAFTGQGTAILRTMQNVNIELWNTNVKPEGATDVRGLVFGPNGVTSAQNQSQCAKWLSDGTFDPLAQTFTLDATTQVAGVELWFTAKGGPVAVQIRETANGVPTQNVIVEKRVAASAITLGGFTRITWVPAVLQANREYAIVVLCDDATTALAVAELGRIDTQLGYVTSQPYQVGVLLSSSNARTWTPHQERDMTFRLLAAQYTETERVIDLGAVNVTGATDLMILGYAERPSAASGLTFDVEFPQSMGSEVVRLTDGQVVWLSAPFTGQLKVRARITGDANAAAVLGPGVQLIAAKLEETATYITRTVAASGNNRVIVVYEGDIPGGSAVKVHAQTSTGGAWTLVPYKSASTSTAGVREITHELTGLAAASGVRVRITLEGGTKARPGVRNLRMAVL